MTGPDLPSQLRVLADIVADQVSSPATLDRAAQALRALADLPVPVTSAEVAEWRARRFGGDPDLLLVALKFVEEVGEIAGAIVKRAEGAQRPEKGLVTREDWTRHLWSEIGDAGVTLHALCSVEGGEFADAIGDRFRGDVARRPSQEAFRFEPGDRVRWTVNGAHYGVVSTPDGEQPAGRLGQVWARPYGEALAEARRLDVADITLVDRPGSTAGLCRTCREPFSPRHDMDAPGPTTRHPFIPTSPGAKGAWERGEGADV